MSQTRPVDASKAWYRTKEYLTGRPLTELELRAVALAAEGLTDQEIAKRLRVTAEMAGQSLHRAAWKLGTRGRAGAVTSAYMRGLLPHPPVPEVPLVKLPPRRFEVLKLVARGLTDEQIGAKLGLATTTVATHVKLLRKDICARNRAHIVRRALDVGAVYFVRTAPAGEEP